MNPRILTFLLLFGKIGHASAGCVDAFTSENLQAAKKAYRDAQEVFDREATKLSELYLTEGPSAFERSVLAKPIKQAEEKLDLAAKSLDDANLKVMVQRSNAPHEMREQIKQDMLQDMRQIEVHLTLLAGELTQYEHQSGEEHLIDGFRGVTLMNHAAGYPCIDSINKLAIILEWQQKGGFLKHAAGRLAEMLLQLNHRMAVINYFEENP